MPEDKEDFGDGELEHVQSPWDVALALVQAVRDILNDWKVAVAFLLVVLLIFGRVAAPELGAMVSDWIRAWKCTP